MAVARDVAGLSQLLICAGGIYVSFITYGYLQEYVYTYVSPSGKAFKSLNSATLIVLLAQTMLNAMYASVSSFYFKDPPVPIRHFALPGLTYIGAMMASNEALKFVSYPLQVLAKSCKLVPVMLVNVVFYKRKQTIWQYVHVALVTAGIVLFRWQSGRQSQDSSTYGLILLGISLAMDGVTGPTQEWLRDRVEPTKSQFILYCNLWAVVYLSIGIILTPSATDDLMFLFEEQNRGLIPQLAIFCICGTIGQVFIFMTLTSFGSLALTTVTTTRKFFTILFSVFLYGHILSTQQWLGVLLVFLGLAVEGWDKTRSRKTKEIRNKKSD